MQETLRKDYLRWEYDPKYLRWTIVDRKVVKCDYRLYPVEKDGTFYYAVIMSEFDTKRKLIKEYLTNGDPIFFKTKKAAVAALDEVIANQILDEALGLGDKQYTPIKKLGTSIVFDS